MGEVVQPNRAHHHHLIPPQKGVFRKRVFQGFVIGDVETLEIVSVKRPFVMTPLFILETPG